MLWNACDKKKPTYIAVVNAAAPLLGGRLST
jgi:hypothetical protein